MLHLAAFVLHTGGGLNRCHYCGLICLIIRATSSGTSNIPQHSDTWTQIGAQILPEVMKAFQHGFQATERRSLVGRIRLAHATRVSG